jgi:hypothetical protein
MEKVISSAKNYLRVYQDSFQIHLNLLQHPSITLSCIRKVNISVNGQPVPIEAISIQYYNHVYSLKELTSLNIHFNDQLNPLGFRISLPDMVRLGYHYEIEVEISFQNSAAPLAVDQPLEKLVYDNILVAC